MPRWTNLFELCLSAIHHCKVVLGVKVDDTANQAPKNYTPTPSITLYERFLWFLFFAMFNRSFYSIWTIWTIYQMIKLD